MKANAKLGIILTLGFQAVCWGSASNDTLHEREDQLDSHIWMSDNTGPINRFRRSLDEFCAIEKGISIGLVIDTTGSMSGEIAEVKKFAINLLNELTNAPGNRICDLVFVPTNDERRTEENYVKTRTLNVLTKAIENIVADGGGTCPERTLVGVEKAIDLSYDGSFIFVFTDADPNDAYLYETIKNKMERKKITIYFLLTGVCDTEPAESFVKLALGRGMSQLAHIDKNPSDLRNIIQSLKDLFQNNTVLLGSETGPATTDEGKKFPVIVPPKTPELRLTGSGKDIEVELKDPEGSTPKNITTLTDVANFKIFSISDPAPGKWTVTLKSKSDYKVVTSAVSNINIEYGFSTALTEDIKGVAKSPGKDVESYLLLLVSSPTKVFNVSVVDIIVGSSIKESLIVDVVDADKGIFRAKKIIYPNESFSIRITAFTSDGHIFTRESLTTIQSQEPGPPVIECKDKMLASAGVAFNMTCSVETQTVVEVRMYKEGSTHTHTDRHQETARVFISFPVLLTKDSGNYIIEATNAKGRVTKKIQLKVIENPPKASIDKALSVVVAGVDTTIDCRCDSFTDCTIEWTKSDSPADDFSQKPALPLLSGENVEVGKVDVILTPALSKDAGWYICTARNGGGTSVAKTYLEVQERPEVEILDSSKAPVSLVTFKQWSTVTITCSAKKGVPPPRLDWFRHNRPISESKNTTIRGKNYVTLTIRNSQIHNQGNYTCSGFNDVGVDEKYVTLQFVQKPRISRPSTYKPTFLVGFDAVLICYFDGTPTPSITWTRLKGDSFTTIEGRVGSQAKAVMGTATLTLPNVTFEDTGTYYCEASNVAGSQKKQMSLRVEEKPAFEITTDDVTVPLYGTIELPCNPKGIPVPTIAWRKIDGNLAGKIVGTNYIITNAALEEQGVYVCRAENIHGGAEFRVKVGISGTAPPKLYKDSKSNIQKRLPGSNITLNCPIIQGEPVPTLTWIHSGRTIRNGYPYTISQEYRSLTIDPVSEVVTGNYTCIAENQLGKDNKTYTLALYKPPIIIQPAGPTFVRTEERAKLICSTEADPVATVNWFQVKKKQETHIPQVTSLVSSKLEVPEGSVKRRAKYLCRASNSVGVAEKVFEVVVIKPPRIKVRWEKKIRQKGDDEIILNCTASGNPKPIYTWTHDGKLVSALESNPIYRVRDGSGNYGCTASNHFGKDVRLTLIERFGPPEIKKLPAVTQVRNGESVVLNCPVSGFPAPTITWRFNGNEVVRRRGPEYEIPKISHKLEGNYTCIATNSEGSAAGTTRLVVTDAPIINCEKPSYEVRFRQLANFVCEVKANPRATIKWYKDGRPWGSSYQDGTLQFVVGEHDAGLFKIEAVNELGRHFKEIELTVLKPPTFSPSHVKEITVTTGAKAVLPCQADGFPQPKSFWDVLSIPDPRKYSAESGSLAIDDVRIDDEGDYKCIAENKVGSQIHFIHLSVAEKPKVTIVTKNVQTNGDVNSGDDVVLMCNVKGKPIPELSWFKDDLHLSTDRVVRFKASESKSGNYVCKASNSYGEANDSISINALSSPVITGLPYEQVKGAEGHELELSCSASGNPLPSISWFRNDRKLQNTPETKVDGPKLRISKLSRELSGNITCEASNSRGKFIKKFELIVNTSPKVDDSVPKEIQIYFNTEFAVPCKAEGSPKPFIEWAAVIGGVSRILSPGENYNGFTVLPDGTLVGRNVTWTEDRNVSCSASNIAGTDFSRHVLRVSELPNANTTILKLVKRIPSAAVVTTKQGKRTVLDCPSKPMSYTSAPWLKNFRDISPSDYSSGRYRLLDNGTKLSVNFPDETDIATFTCVDSRSGRNSFILNVMAEPHFLESAVTEYKVVENDQLDVSCRAGGNPLPLIFWYVKDAAFDWIPINNYTMKNAQFTGTQNEYLYINSSITSHTGQYKCVARNRNEEQSRLFSISVAAIPKLTGERTVTKFVDFGEPFQLTCQVEGEPDIVYQWFISKDGKKRRLSTGNKVMQFSSSSFADKASYECTATSSTGFAQQEFIVNIVVAPRLKGEPSQTIQFFSGETLELECLAEEDTVFMVNWAKGGIKLMGTERLSMIPEGSFGDIMRITNASELDAGDYECTAHNEAGGKDQKNFFLQHIDVIPNSKSVIYFALGEPLKLPCKLANGDSYSKIVWMKNGSVLRRPSLRGNDFYKLETHEGDEGLYECILTRKSDIKLIFEAKMLIPPKMRPTRTKRALEVNLGDDLVMECAAEGDPSPTFYWTKNDEEILSGRDSFLTSSSPNGSLSRLSKRNVSNTDGGRYVCHAWNQIGESYKSDRTFYDVIVVGNSKDDPYSGVTQISPQLNFPFEISCPFYESRPDRVLWKKGGYLWTESNMKSNGFRLTSEDGYSTLRTNSANPNHGDVYVCSGESKKEHTFVVNVSVPMYYKDWTEWSDCSASCGGGIKKRERLCQASVKYQPEDIVTLVQSTCVGHNLVQNQTCNPSPCPVDGGWGEWREGACSRSCGGGVRKRRRLCDNPSPSSGGKTCSGSHEDEIRCGDVPCPVDGGWSDWTKWSGCSSSCGFGWKQRYRFCDRPKPSQGGRPCDGEATDQRRCDLPPCEAKRIGDETAISNKKWIWSEWEVSEDCPPGCDQKKILKKVGRCIGTGCKQLEKTRVKAEPCPQPPGCE